MGKVKQIEIKNLKAFQKTYYFHNNIFDSNLLKIDKKSYKDVDIYHIAYITIKNDCENIYSANPLYLIIRKVDGHIVCNSVECNSAKCNSIEEQDRSKYLLFDSTDENKEVLKKYIELWDGIKNEIETINSGIKGEYGKDFMKIKFNTDNNLPLSKPLKVHLLTIIVTCIFDEDGQFYPQLYLDDCLYELRVASNI